MRSRLLASAAVLAAGLAMASAQNAPSGSGQEHTRNPARSQHEHAPAAAARKAEQTLRSRASVLSPRGQWGRGDRDRRDGMSGDRSTWDRAMGQGRLQPEQETRPGRRQLASPLAKERGQQDLAPNKTPGERDAHARNQACSVTLHADKHRGGAPDADAGQDRVREVQTALNQQGFNVGDPDGKLGKRTREALIAFQKQRGFRTTGKIDRTTLHALLAGGIAPGGAQVNPAAPASGPTQLAPQGVAPATTGHGGAAPQPAASPEPTDGETPPAQVPQMPDSGATGRVPAGSPQEDYKDDAPQGGGDRR